MYREEFSCMELCVGLQGCVGVDFDTRVNKVSGGCYIYFDVERELKTVAAPFINHYRVTGRRCRGLPASTTAPGGSASTVVPSTPPPPPPPITPPPVPGSKDVFYYR